MKKESRDNKKKSLDLATLHVQTLSKPSSTCPSITCAWLEQWNHPHSSSYSYFNFCLLVKIHKCLPGSLKKQLGPMYQGAPMILTFNSDHIWSISPVFNVFFSLGSWTKFVLLCRTNFIKPLENAMTFFQTYGHVHLDCL